MTTVSAIFTTEDSSFSKLYFFNERYPLPLEKNNDKQFMTNKGTHTGIELKPLNVPSNWFLCFHLLNNNEPFNASSSPSDCSCISKRRLQVLLSVAICVVQLNTCEFRNVLCSTRTKTSHFLYRANESNNDLLFVSCSIVTRLLCIK